MKAFDDVAWETITDMTKEWLELLEYDMVIYRDVGIFLSAQYSSLQWTDFGYCNAGTFNAVFRMRFANEYSAIIRFPLPAATMFPEEKVRNEVSVMQFLLNKIPIPVPRIFCWGKRQESPSYLGPFIIMDFIDHKQSMSDFLNTPRRQPDQLPVLNPDLDLGKLGNLYRQLGNIILSLSTLSFSKIGSLDQKEGVWEVLHRPLSYSMNEIVSLGTLPRSKLPTTTYNKASLYFEALAELHITHLRSQRNEANIEANIELNTLADDYRRQFVARFLFRKIACDQGQREKWILHENGPFPLWCDDLRPGNFLVNEAGIIVGVVDWEYTYTAPVEFNYAPPWWLLLCKPESWDRGLDDWCTEYTKALQTFLEAMKQCEDELVRNGKLRDGQRLSSQMRDSWQSGDFWIMYAARNNFAFDAIYWKKIDQRFFGPAACDDQDVWKERLHLLEPGDVELIEEYVKLKLDEKKEEKSERILAWDADEYTLGWVKKLPEMQRERHERQEREKEEAGSD
ncbi:hypothetical protein N7466_006474 [Penicillium verhagenii]|uniref:uncharacterized protein n=1 Tax=Penicillium verhagenii TaxID=1562060 RepID=UPI0025451191|nr:uncharacterized protein N7466_006474 [Penicillium verhagenii]KAJ5930981.1 hypothetical protein N7466_006474 [Penicillium verhagenii]